jgi:hypothetical protein
MEDTGIITQEQQEQFIKNYESMIGPHDARVKAVVKAKNDTRRLVDVLGGSYVCTAQNLNVLNMPKPYRTRYFSDDELIEMTEGV